MKILVLCIKIWILCIIFTAFDILYIYYSKHILGDDSRLILGSNFILSIYLIDGDISIHGKWWLSATSTTLSFITILDPCLLHYESYDAWKKALSYFSLLLLAGMRVCISFVLKNPLLNTKKEKIRCRIIERHFKNFMKL